MSLFWISNNSEEWRILEINNAFFEVIRATFCFCTSRKPTRITNLIITRFG